MTRATSILLVIWAGVLWLRAAAPLPCADEVLRRMLERSAQVARQHCTNFWAYDKKTIQEELDSDLKVLKSTEKLYRVEAIRGVPFSRLLKVNGKELPEAERRKQDEREEQLRRKLSGRDPRAVGRGQEAMVSEDLVKRFQFEVTGRESLQGRTALAVQFVPRADQPKDTTPEGQLLSRLVGTVWVDETTAEVAALDVRLTKAFSMGFLGMLGSLKECRFKLSRTAMPDGAWVSGTSDLRFSARMLTTQLRFHIRESSSSFKLEQ